MSFELVSFLVLLFVVIVGFLNILKQYYKCNKLVNFANEFRNNFVEFVNTYLGMHENGNNNQPLFNSDLYTWLTKNVDQIQMDMGGIGKMYYMAPYRAYQVQNYQIVLNTLPKFRLGKADDFDINSSDDCLIRHIGILENNLSLIRRQLKNPIIWFKEGFQLLIATPLYVFTWFGILSDQTVANVIRNKIWRVLSGIGGLITFVSGVVTIIQGKEETILLYKQLFNQ